MILALWLAACSAPPAPDAPLAGGSPSAVGAPSAASHGVGAAHRASATLGDGSELAVSLDAPEVVGTDAALTGTAELVPPASATRSLLFTLDVSASVLVPGEGCGDDFNEDGLSDTVLDCELAGAWLAIQRAGAWGDVGEVGFVVFQVLGHWVDMSPDSGSQRYTAPDADLDADGEPDVLTVLKSMGYVDGTWRDPGLGVDEFTHYEVSSYIAGGTNYREAFSDTCTLLTRASYASRLDIFLSDGQGTFGGAVTDVLPCAEPVTIEAIAVGAGACDSDPSGYGSMREVATLGGGDCVEVSDPDALADAILSPVTPRITAATLTVDDGAAVDVSSDFAEGLPYDGAGAIHFARTVTDLAADATLCLAVTAEAGGGATTVTDCQLAQVDQAPVLAEAGDIVVDEGSVTSLEASATDADGDALTWAWSTTGPFPLVGATTASPSLYALDDAAFDVTVEASDGQLIASDTRTITVENVAPTVTVTLAGGEVTLAQVTFTDPGIADTHTLTVDWGDGALETVAAAVDGAGWGVALLAHRYTGAGDHAVTVELADDDGGSATWAGAAAVGAPLAVFATGTSDDALTTSGGTIRGRVHSNGGLAMTGSGAVDGPVEYGSVATVDAGVSLSEPPVLVAAGEPPRTWSVDDYRPGGAAAVAAGADYHDLSDTCVGLVRWRVSEELAPGLYYAPCDVELRVAQADVTVVTEGTAYVTDGGVERPFVDGLALLAGADLAIDTTGATWIGALAAPSGAVELGGAGNVVIGTVLGERVALTDSGVELTGSDPSIEAGPEAVVVPRLLAEVENDVASALPASAVTTTAVVRHEGVDLVLPVLFLATNHGESTAELTAATVTLESWDGAAWSTLDAEVGGVGPEGVPTAGESLGAGETRAWTAWLHATLDPDGWARVAGGDVRARVSTTWIEGAAVETSGPLGSVAALPADAAVSGAELWVAGIDGLVDVVDAGALAPGETFTGAVAATWSAPAQGADEGVDDWVARLLEADEAPLAAMATGRATAGVGAVVAPQVLAWSTSTLPVVSFDARMDAALVAGVEGSGEVSLAELGSSAAGVAWSCALGTTATATAELVTGELRTDPLRLTPDEAGEGSLACSWSWTDPAGGAYGPALRTLAVDVASPAALSLSLVDALADDPDGDGLPSPGDTLRYTLTGTNTGDVATDDVRVDLPLDASTTLVGGATDTGSIRLDGGSVAVDWGALAPGGVATATVDVLVSADVPSVSVQGSATTGDATVQTDDPSVAGASDATVTPIASSSPALIARLAASLRIDADGDGGVSTGDTVHFALATQNPGAAAVRGITLRVPAADGTALVAGSVTTTAGVVTGAAEVGVDLGDLGSTEGATVGFDLLLTGAPGTTVSVQGSLAATDFAGVTDDPTTAASDDPTSFGIGGTIVDDVAAPVVTWTTPAAGERIAVPTALAATVTTADGEEPASWTLELVDGAGASSVLATGAGAPALDDLDPTVLANGVWVLRLEASDRSGHTGAAELPIEVAGDAKLGAYDVAFVDAEWRTGAFPVQILRTYRTTRRAESGDFGPGWALSVVDFQLQRNGPVGEGGWRQEGCGGGLVFATICTVADQPHLVAVRWPDGHVEAFDVTPGAGSSFFAAITTVAYTPRAGVTSTLTPVAGDETATFLDGNLYTGLDVRTVYDPQQVWLTDRDGVRYLLDRDEGLVELIDRDGNVTTFGPDGIVPARGDPVTWTRDSVGRITSVDLPDGGALTYGYDAAGDLVSVVDGTGDTSTFRYADDHLLVAYGADGHPPVATMTYDEDGRMVAAEDAAGVFTEHSADLEAWTETIVGPDPDLTTVLAYDEDGQLTSLVRRFGGEELAWSWTYDEAFRPITSTTPSGATAEVAYDDAGRVTEAVDADGLRTELAWTANGDLTEAWVGGALVHAMVFDDAGHPLEATSPTGATLATWTWTDWGGPSSWVDADGVGGSAELDDNGGLHALVTADRRIELVKDAWGTGVGLVDTLGEYGTAEMDAAGRETAFTDVNGYQQRWTYDPNGWLTEATDKLGRSDVYTRDAAGNVTTVTRRGGAVVSYTYDAAGRVERIDGGDVFVAYAYDALGRVVSVENADVIVEIAYDADGALATMGTRPVTAGRFPEGTTTFGWTAGGRLSSVATDWGSVSYGWDAQGRPSRLTDSLTGSWSYGYDADNRLTTVSRSSGQTRSFGYTPAGRLASLVSDAVETTFGYDGSGRLVSREDAAGAHTFAYDERGRLTTATHASGAADEAYGYDLNTNRSDGPSPADRLESDARWTYTWDADGRLSSRTERSTGATTTYTWNAFDELVAIDAPTGRTTFVYDGLGRRVEVDWEGSRWTFVYLGAEVQGILDPDGALWSWETHGLDGELLAEWRPEGVREAWTDERGTRTGWWSDGSWSWSWRSAYGAGETPTEVEASAYTWHAGDPTGLVYMRARYYDPEIGRFLSEDPLPAGNLYVYAGGDPVGSWDPTGMAEAVEYGTNASADAEEAPAEQKLGQKVACRLLEAAEAVADGPGACAVALVTEGCGGRPEPSNGERACTRLGRRMHSEWDPGPGFQKEVRLPSGLRADAVNFVTREVLELKPNNPRAIAAGIRQVTAYASELSALYGDTFIGRVVTY